MKLIPGQVYWGVQVNLPGIVKCKRRFETQLEAELLVEDIVQRFDPIYNKSRAISTGNTNSIRQYVSIHRFMVDNEVDCE